MVLPYTEPAGSRALLLMFLATGRRIIADESECLEGVWRDWLAHWVLVAGLRVRLLTDVFLHPNTALERAAYGDAGARLHS